MIIISILLSIIEAIGAFIALIGDILDSFLDRRHTQGDSDTEIYDKNGNRVK